jgi:microcystin-dependent protein
MPSFKVVNQAQNVIANKLNYEVVPKIQSYDALQIGEYKISARNSDYNGWLVCNGRAVLIANYPELYALIGADFGSAPANYFRLPDFTSKALGMFGASSNVIVPYTTRTRGTTFGSETVTLTVGQLAAHNHTGTTDSSGTHTHGITDPGHAHSYVNNTNDQSTDSAFATESAADNLDLAATTGSSGTNITINSDGAHVHTFTSNNTGSNDPINIVQPTLFGVSVLIFAKFIPREELISTPY